MAVCGHSPTFRHATDWRHQYVNCTVRIACRSALNYSEPYFVRNEGEPVMPTVAQTYERCAHRRKSRN